MAVSLTAPVDDSHVEPMDIITLHPCEICGKAFREVRLIRKHLRRTHKMVLPKEPTKQRKFVCNAFGCEKSYSTKGELQGHQKKMHLEKAAAEQEKFKLCSEIVCPDENCSERCVSRAELRKHITEAHGIKIEQTDLTFSTREEFNNWKNEIEKAECAYYRKTCAKVAASRLPNNEEFREFFWCHRSGEYICEAEDVNNPKRAPRTMKIGKTCPAMMRVTTKSDEPIVYVQFFKPHVGHSPDPLMKISLPKSKRKYVRKTKSSETKSSATVPGKQPQKRLNVKTKPVKPKTSMSSINKTTSPLIDQYKNKQLLSELDNFVVFTDIVDGASYQEEANNSTTQLVLSEEIVLACTDPILNETSGEFDTVDATYFPEQVLSEQVHDPVAVNLITNIVTNHNLDTPNPNTVNSNKTIIFNLDGNSVLQQSTNSVQNVKENTPPKKLKINSHKRIKIGVKKGKMLKRLQELYDLVKNKNT